MLDLKGNFKIGILDRKCRKCEATEETQEHLLDCPALMDSSLVQGRPRYDDLFGAEPSITGKILQSKFKLYFIELHHVHQRVLLLLYNTIYSIELDHK